MRLTIAASDLHDALKQSAYARGATPLDQLKHVLIETIDPQHLAIEATDLTTRTRIVVPADVTQAGAVMLDGDKLLAVATGGGELQLTDTGRLTRGRSRYQLPAMPVSEFPRAAELEFAPIDIDPVELAAGIAQVQHAADEKDARAYCRAVFLAHGRLTAGNGIVMSTVGMPGDHPVVLIPVGQVRHLDGLLHKDSRLLIGNVRGEPVDSGVQGSPKTAALLRVEAGSVTVTITCIDQTPFDVRRLLDAGALERPVLTFKRKALAEAVRRFSPFVIVYGKSDSGIVLQSKDGRVSIADGTADASNLEDVSDHVVSGSDADFAVGIAHRYLLSVLGAIPDDEVDLYLHPTKPHLILPHGGNLEQAAHLIAPQALR